MNILHLSHTDINSDSRILKEMHTLASSNKHYKLEGIGISRTKERSFSNHIENINIYGVTLKLRNLKFLPKFLRHFMSLIELYIKMFVKASRFRPSVIHCHDTFVLPLGVIIKILFNSNLVYDAHELESNRNGLSKKFGKFTLFVEKLLWKKVDALIVVSPSIETWYKENIGDKTSTVILNSPVLEKEKNNAYNNYLRKHFSIDPKSKIFLYVGFLANGRGIDLVVEAFKKNDITSSLIFLGYGDLSDELKALSKQNSNIYVHDKVEHYKVVAIAKSADVGLCLIQNVSLSDYYCLPNKLFEYSFAEIPILASNFPEIAKTVEKYKLGKCTELNVKSIYSSIKKLEEMDDLPKVNSDDLYELSWSAQEKKLVKLYNELIERRK